MGVGSFTGCATVGKTPTEVNPPEGTLPTQHILMFNKDGHAVDPTGNIFCENNLLNDTNLELCNGKHATIWPLTLTHDYEKLEFLDNETERFLFSGGTSFDLGIAYEVYLSEMFSSMNTFFNDQKRLGKENKKIMLFVHGGLNTQVETLERVVQRIRDCDKNTKSDSADCNKEENLSLEEKENQRLYKRILQEGYYPIFINWHSWLFSTYMEHLFLIRQGEKRPVLGPLSFPFYLITDIGRSILRSPMIWASITENNLKTIPLLSPVLNNHRQDQVKRDIACRKKFSNDNDKESLKKCLGKKITPPDSCLPFSFARKDSPLESINNWVHSGRIDETGQFNLSTGNDEQTCTQMYLTNSRFVYTSPTKLASVPLIDTFGTSAWNNMLRRVKLLFRSDSEFDKESDNEGGAAFKAHQDISRGLTRIKPTGTLSIFMEKLSEIIRTNNPGSWEITLIGHSMGAIVSNEIIRNYGIMYKPKEKPFVMPFNNIGGCPR